MQLATSSVVKHYRMLFGFDPFPIHSECLIDSNPAKNAN